MEAAEKDEAKTAASSSSSSNDNPQPRGTNDPTGPRQKKPKIPDNRYSALRTKPIAEHQIGYPQFASYIDTDANFRVFRRFGTLRTRILLQRQVELAKMEKALEEADEEDFANGNLHRLQSIRKDKEDAESRRQALIEEADQKLKQYDNLLEREHRSLQLASPSKRNHRSVVNFLWNKKDIVKSEIDLYNRVDDVIILSKNYDSWFQARVEDLLQEYTKPWFQRWFISEQQQEKSEGTYVQLYSQTRINVLIQVIVTIISVILLMVPVTLLYTLDTTQTAKVIVVLTFVCAFPIAVAVFAQPKTHELFAVTAAYTAVLVVFLTNFGNDPTKEGIK